MNGDEWGLYDPNRCGFAALVDKLNEVTDDKDDKTKKTKIDWADAHSDAFQVELYQPMRRQAERTPFDRGATPIAVDGLNMEDFDTDESRMWRDLVPREPIR